MVVGGYGAILIPVNPDLPLGTGLPGLYGRRKCARKEYVVEARLRARYLVRVMERLSEHDEAVLNVMFDPLQLAGSSVASLNYGNDTPDDRSMDTEIVKLSPEVVEIVARAIEATKNESFDESIRLFDKAIAKAPKSAAVLNDRAQVLRLVGRNDDALKDLNLAVELSKGRGKPGIQALCQRGVLHRCAGRTEDARRDFELASLGGSSFARRQLVNLNPYAAMCNAMLRDISEKSWCSND